MNLTSLCFCRAFASYVENAGGCDHIQDIVCDATNIQVIKAYSNYAEMGNQYKTALDCLVSRCGLTQISRE
jgi:hypothetical protein